MPQALWGHRGRRGRRLALEDLLLLCGVLKHPILCLLLCVVIMRETLCM